MAEVFVSYASDDRPTAQRIAEHLIAQGWSVWWDRDLTPGLEFAKEIEEVLHDARCVVVIWSGNSAESRWVQDEAREGLERGILVPVRIDESQVPLGFRGVQTADLSDWRGEADYVPLERFEAAISALMDSGPRSPHVDVAGSAGSHTGGLLQSVAAGWAALAVVVLVAGIAVLAVLSNDGDRSATSELDERRSGDDACDFNLDERRSGDDVCDVDRHRGHEFLRHRARDLSGNPRARLSGNGGDGPDRPVHAVCERDGCVHHLQLDCSGRRARQ